ncbi:hypothetical protein MUN88_20350 [Gracilibacillus caseinilyticus]|uniref:Uncharacterized protein n=1 Tax=Gracilibacillus caseinilyticus TaxID=2932256 RepID=A0ABY4EVW0_9BACI|nr:hypothetical protein [Gracilibacillus caseinilyticus]UOQ48358.1 hypothetical protein MUN88_20350 [Gracilibacillus caseinilyticus]
MLEPLINKALYQVSLQNRNDVRQEIHYKIIKKVYDEEMEELPGLIDILKQKDWRSV